MAEDSGTEEKMDTQTASTNHTSENTNHVNCPDVTNQTVMAGDGDSVHADKVAMEDDKMEGDKMLQEADKVSAEADKCADEDKMSMDEGGCNNVHTESEKEVGHIAKDIEEKGGGEDGGIACRSTDGVKDEMAEDAEMDKKEEDRMKNEDLKKVEEAEEEKDEDEHDDKDKKKDEMKEEKEKDGGKKNKKTESAADSESNMNDVEKATSSTEHNETDDSTRHSKSESRSGSDSETETDKDEEEDEAHESDHDISSDLENEIIGRKLPKPKSQVLQDLRSRELGAFQRCITPFCYNFMGSVPLVQRLDKYCELKHHEGCVNTLHFNPSGTLLASGSDDLEIVLWDWAHQKPRLVFESGHRSNVFQAKFMPSSGDATLVSCARDGQVRVAELSTTGICKETKKIVQHKGSAHKLGLEPDSPVVFMSCGEDAAVFNIDLRESKPNKLMVVKEADKKVALYTIFINPSNINEFIVGGRDHFVRVFDKRKITDADDSGVVKKFCPHHLVDNEQVKANVTCCVYSYNGQEILASYNDEDIYLFDSTHSDGADFIRAYKGHRNNATVKGVNFYGPKSEFIVSGSDCGNVFLWEKDSEKIVQYMQGDVGGVVNCLEPHPWLPCLATSGLDHDVKVWLPTRKTPTELDGLKKVMMTNRREREEERTRGPPFEENAMLRFLMAHLRHRARRQAMEAGELDSSDSDDSDSDSDDLPTASCATS